MGLFGHKNDEVPVQAAPPPRTSTTSTNGERRSFFSRGRSSSPDTMTTNKTNSSTNGSGGLFHRNREDPSIVQARQRVHDAEAAERNADRALVQARAAVRDAREDIKRLEREAAEEARLAKIKQHQAAGISKSAKHLGRHGVS